MARSSNAPSEPRSRGRPCGDISKAFLPYLHPSSLIPAYPARYQQSWPEHRQPEPEERGMVAELDAALMALTQISKGSTDKPAPVLASSALDSPPALSMALYAQATHRASCPIFPEKILILSNRAQRTHRTFETEWVLVHTWTICFTQD